MRKSPNLSAAAASREVWTQWLAPPQKKGTQLARAVTQELLNALKVPSQFHAARSRRVFQRRRKLLECVVPQDVLGKVIDAVTGRPIEQVVDQPDLVLEHTDDLLRYRDGELLGFLLRLNVEQEKLVGWALGSKGATLLKGGPGTCPAQEHRRPLPGARDAARAPQGEGRAAPGSSSRPTRAPSRASPSSSCEPWLARRT